MPAMLIEETDPLEVTALCVLIYGPPGVGKTSLAQTGQAPVTLDFDRGIPRSAFRKTAFRFGSWEETAGGDVKERIALGKEVVVDTVGRMLDQISQSVMNSDSKNRTRAGDLSITGWGALKSTFARWMGQMRLLGKDVVLIAHEKEERDGDEKVWRPDIQGGSYGEVMKFTDLVGYLGVVGGKKILNFNPTDRTLGKNSAGFEPVTIPNFAEQPRFFADLLAEAKRRIGQTAKLSAKIADETTPWVEWLGAPPSLEEFNKRMPELGKLSEKAKKQVWNLCMNHASNRKWAFNPENKSFQTSKAA